MPEDRKRGMRLQAGTDTPEERREVWYGSRGPQHLSRDGVRAVGAQLASRHDRRAGRACRWASFRCRPGQAPP